MLGRGMTLNQNHNLIRLLAREDVLSRLAKFENGGSFMVGQLTDLIGVMPGIVEGPDDRKRSFSFEEVERIAAIYRLRSFRMSVASILEFLDLVGRKDMDEAPALLLLEQHLDQLRSDQLSMQEEIHALSSFLDQFLKTRKRAAKALSHSRRDLEFAASQPETSTG
jgi:DNA-binding transcriptional MerR regulator